MPDWLTDSLTTLKDRATQLLIKYKSGALVTQNWIKQREMIQWSWKSCRGSRSARASTPAGCVIHSCCSPIMLRYITASSSISSLSSPSSSTSSLYSLYNPCHNLHLQDPHYNCHCHHINTIIITTDKIFSCINWYCKVRTPVIRCLISSSFAVDMSNYEALYQKTPRWR